MIGEDIRIAGATYNIARRGVSRIPISPISDGFT